MKIQKKYIPSLIDEVVIPFQQEHLSLSDRKDIDRFRHNILLTKFAVMFFHHTKGVERDFVNLLDFYKQLDIGYHQLVVCMSDFFKLFEEWMRKHNIVSKEHFENVKDVYIYIFKHYEFSLEQEKDEEIMEEEDFFFIEDEGVEESINSMHYEDKDKISAKEYFANNSLNSSDIEDMILMKEMFVEILDGYSSFSDDFIDSFSEALLKLNSSLHLLFATKEFKDIGYGLEKFSTFLEYHNFKDERIENLLFDILLTFIDDLVKWLDSLFIKQDVVDIHYLDASLLSNITQFQIMVEQEEFTDDTDMLFFGGG